MYNSKLLLVLLLSILLSACGNKKDVIDQLALQTNAVNNTLQNGNQIAISLKAKGDVVIDSVAYFLDKTPLGSNPNFSTLTAAVNVKKLGRKKLSAKVYYGEKVGLLTKEILVLSPTSPKLYHFEVVNTYPHDTQSYTQGLEFENGVLYESAGNYQKSALLKTNFVTGAIEQRVDLDDKYFAEGLTIINNKIIQLTWRENIGFIYDLNTFEKKETFTYNKSKEGWGLCNDGKTIYKSDGTSKIWLLDPQTLAEQDYIEVVDNKALRSKYNELEWVNGKIYANTYQNNGISVINPETGAIEAVIDLRSLREKVQSGLDEQNEVLNGIAYNPDTKKLYVTGKHWNTLFEINIIE